MINLTEVLRIVEIAAPSISTSGSSTLYMDSTTHKVRLSQNAGAYFNILTTNDTFTTSVNGAVPAPGSSTGKILSDAGTWITAGGMSIGGSVTSGTTGSILFIGAGPVLSQDNSALFWHATNKRLGINNASPAAVLDIDNLAVAQSIFIARDNGTPVFTIGDNGEIVFIPTSGFTNDAFTITAGTVADAKKALSLTATFPSSTSGAQIGALMSFTTAGSTSNDQRGLQVLMSAGYTGASNTYGGLFSSSASTSDTNNPITNPTVFGTASAVAGFTHGSGAGNRTGLYGYSDTGTTNNIGMLGYGWVSNGMSGTAYGAIGVATAQAGISGPGIGGYFALATGAGTINTSGSVALVADNQTIATNIFEARDNGTSVFKVKDAGVVVAANDISFSDSTKGLILKDSAGTPHYWRVTVNTSGVLVITDTGTTAP